MKDAVNASKICAANICVECFAASADGLSRIIIFMHFFGTKMLAALRAMVRSVLLQGINQGTFMSVYRVRSTKGVHVYDRAEPFLREVSNLLQQGLPFGVQVLREAIHVLQGLAALLKQQGISVVIDPHSPAEASDYIANIFAGAVVGGVGFGATGALTWAGLRAVGLAVPSAAPFIAVASLLGLTVGAIGGGVATRYGLRIRFSSTGRQETVVMDFQRA